MSNNFQKVLSSLYRTFAFVSKKTKLLRHFRTSLFSLLTQYLKVKLMHLENRLLSSLMNILTTPLKQYKNSRFYFAIYQLARNDIQKQNHSNFVLPLYVFRHLVLILTRSTTNLGTVRVYLYIYIYIYIHFINTYIIRLSS